MGLRSTTGYFCILAALVLPLCVFQETEGLDADGYRTCYSYTWTGKNESIDCEDHEKDIMNEPQPCMDTLVYTTPYDMPPNTSDLLYQCQSVQKCPVFTCRTSKDRCVKISWWDVGGKIVNYSSFCGKVVDSTEEGVPEEIYYDSLMEMQVGTYTKKVWVCSENYCNTSRHLRPPALLTLLLATILLLATLVTPWTVHLDHLLSP